MNKRKHSKTKAKINRVQLIFFIILMISVFCIAYYYYHKQKEKQNPFDNIKIDTSQITEDRTERMLQVEALKKENEDIIGWLEIPNTKINFPVMQGTDNEYYMTHTYKKEKSKDGSIFLDKDYDWDLPSSNLLLYGHNNKNGNMFEGLLEYKEENYYKEHPTIKFTTTKEDGEYEIIAVFLSRVYYKSEKNVFRYYYFVNAENEEEYNEFVNNAKQASIYDTGMTSTYGEQLITLSTCEYSREDGRFVVVAKKV